MGLSTKERDARYLSEMQADPGDPRHGKPSGYGYGCRCERCRASYSEYMRGVRAYSKKKRLKEMQENPNDRAHGTVHGYNCGCRCERCREAGLKNAAEKNAKRYKAKTCKPKPEKKSAKAERAARWKADREAQYSERERRSERVRALVAGGEGRWRRMTE